MFCLLKGITIEYMPDSKFLEPVKSHLKGTPNCKVVNEILRKKVH